MSSSKMQAIGRPSVGYNTHREARSGAFFASAPAAPAELRLELERIQFRRVVNRPHYRLYSKGHSSGFKGRQINLRIGRGCGVEQEDDAVNGRRDLLEQLHPLTRH